MKKTLIGIIMAMFSFGSVSAEVGLNVGLSGAGAVFGATATESDIGPNVTEKNTESDYLGAAYGSIFVEKELGLAFIGVDYVLSAIETEQAESLRNDCTTEAKCNTGAFTQVTNKVKVEFNDFATVYAGLRISDNFYAKVGFMTVDLDTKENLGTGSTYNNTSMDGQMIGVGGQANLANGMFIRGEANYLDFDPVELTSSTGVNKISIDTLSGIAAKVSIGRAF